MFYNDSSFDGLTPAAQGPVPGANNDDDDALAPEIEPSPDPDPTQVNRKVALLPGQTASAANYTSYSKGLNGLMVDLAMLPKAGDPVTAADFTFKVYNDSTASWVTAAAPTSVSSRLVQASSFAVQRVTLIWADGAIKNTWLQVTVAANARTGATAPDVFYFGNLAGESKYDVYTGYFIVNAFDSSQTHLHEGDTSVTIANLYDHNRDGYVNPDDTQLAYNNSNSRIIQLVAP